MPYSKRILLIYDACRKSRWHANCAEGTHSMNCNLFGNRTNAYSNNLCILFIIMCTSLMRKSFFFFGSLALRSRPVRSTFGKYFRVFSGRSLLVISLSIDVLPTFWLCLLNRTGSGLSVFFSFYIFAFHLLGHFHYRFSHTYCGTIIIQSHEAI